jgi:hypothetical protein
MNPQSLSFEFIALFNELDKYLEGVINDCDQHMNFAHKLKIISQGVYPMSRVVKQYFYELNYLGELRNQLVHGISLDGIDYVTPTDHAIQEMSRLSDLIMNHLDHECIVTPDDLLTEVVAHMVDAEQDHVLVYEDGVYQYDLDQTTILQALTHRQGSIQGLKLVDLGLKHAE